MTPVVVLITSPPFFESIPICSSTPVLIVASLDAVVPSAVTTAVAAKAAPPRDASARAAIKPRMKPFVPELLLNIATLPSLNAERSPQRDPLKDKTGDNKNPFGYGYPRALLVSGWNL